MGLDNFLAGLRARLDAARTRRERRRLRRLGRLFAPGGSRRATDRNGRKFTKRGAIHRHNPARRPPALNPESKYVAAQRRKGKKP